MAGYANAVEHVIQWAMDFSNPVALRKEAERLKKLVAVEDERLEKSRLSTLGHRENHMFVLLSGIKINTKQRDLYVLGYLKELDVPLRVDDLLRCSSGGIDYYSIARAFNYPCVELCIDKALVGDDYGKSAYFAHLTTSLIKIRMETDFSVIAISDHPWSAMPNIQDGRVGIRHLELPQSIVFTKKDPLDSEIIADFISRHFLNFGEMVNDNDAFSLAVRAYAFDHLQRDLRLKMANIWLGIEALFPAMSELNFRVATYISLILEPYGESRYTRYRTVSKLYGLRSKAVHGAKIKDDALTQGVRESKELLAQIIRKFIEIGHVPSIDDLNMYLLGAKEL